MTGADFWRVGFGAEFAANIERIAASLEKISKILDDRRTMQDQLVLARQERDVIAAELARLQPDKWVRKENN